MHLVVQSPSLTPAQVDELSAMLRKRPQRLSDGAFRFRGIPDNEGVAPWCEARKIDYAFMPEGRRFADLKLLAMDMDSTLITIECIDELGDMAGKKAEVAAVTARAMRGEIEYQQSLRDRVAVLEGLEESVLSRVYEQRLLLTPGAEPLIAACKRHGVKILLVSGGFTFFTERLKARLDLDYTISNTLEVRDGRLTGHLVGPIVDAWAKAEKFSTVLEDLGAKPEQGVAIGDGANDVEMMTRAGWSVAFRAKPVVREQASCSINWCGLDAVINLFE